MRRILKKVIALSIAICLGLGTVNVTCNNGIGRVNAEENNSISATYFKKVSLKKKTLKLTWVKRSGIDGYEIQYGTSKSFKESATKTVIVNKASTVEKTIKKIPQDKTYYYRIRTLKNVSESIEDEEGNSIVEEKTVYSKWSRKVATIAYDKSWKYGSNSVIHSDVAVLYYAGEKKSNGITVCVNAGHGTKGGSSKKTLCHPDGTAKVTGGSTSKGAKYATAVSGGTTLSDGTKEATANLDIAKKLKTVLLDEGYNVLLIRESSDVQLDNVARTVLANNNADCHIAIHYDSTSSNKGAFYISVPNVKSYRKMTPVKQNYKKHNKLGKALIKGMKDKKVKIFGQGSMAIDLTQTSYSTIPSVDVEVGDRASSHSSSQLDKICKGILKGLNSYYDL